MSHTSAWPPRHNRRVSRRVFLHSTSVIPAALASSDLLRPAARATMPRVDLDGEAVEACESRLSLVADVPLQPLVAQVTRLIAATEYLGAPLPPDHQRELKASFKETNEQSAVMSIQTRARLPLPRGGRDQPRNARESRTGARQAGARGARLAPVPCEGP